MNIYWVIYYFVGETILKWLVDLLLKSADFSSLCCIIMVTVQKRENALLKFFFFSKVCMALTHYPILDLGS